MKTKFVDTRKIMKESGLSNEVEIVVNKYLDGSLHIGLVSCDGDIPGEPWADVTVRLPINPPEGCVFIKNYSENEGMVDLMVENGIIYPEPTMLRTAGFVEISAYRLTKEFVDAELTPRNMAA